MVDNDFVQTDGGVMTVSFNYYVSFAHLLVTKSKFPKLTARGHQQAIAILCNGSACVLLHQSQSVQYLHVTPLKTPEEMFIAHVVR